MHHFLFDNLYTMFRAYKIFILITFMYFVYVNVYTYTNLLDKII